METYTHAERVEKDSSHRTMNHISTEFDPHEKNKIKLLFYREFFFLQGFAKQINFFILFF